MLYQSYDKFRPSDNLGAVGFRGVPCDIETYTRTAASSSTCWVDKLAPKLCNLRLELAKMIARGLILLGCRMSEWAERAGDTQIDILLA